MESNANPGAKGNPAVLISTQAIASKMNSKREVGILHSLISNCFCFQVYRFLTAEVKAYVSSYDTVTIYHLRDLASG